MTNSRKPIFGYKACVVRHLNNQSVELKEALRNDPALAEFERVMRKLSVNRSKVRIATRSSLLRIPDREWFGRYEELFDSCLGSLETFRPAAGQLPEFEKLKALTSKLGHILSFAHALQYEA